MRKSNFEPGGENVFGRIKKKRAAAEASGVKIIDLSVGEPAGPAFEAIRFGMLKAVASDEQAMWRYQDNGCHVVENFPLRFSQVHTKRNLGALGSSIAAGPTCGTKSTLFMAMAGMNSWSDKASEVHVCTMTNPGYNSVVVQCNMLRGTVHHHIPLDPKKGFKFTVDDLKKMNLPKGRTLIMLNFPHNPTGIVATREELEQYCKFCSENDFWISSDSAYAILAFGTEACTLADVAPGFPALNWCDMFSSSKAGNNTGLRVGAIVGSPEYVGDIMRVKNELDSGFVAPAAAGIIHAFENHKVVFDSFRDRSYRKMKMLRDILDGAGMRLAAEARGGFFLLCDAPQEAFGEEIANAEEFNDQMMSKTGILGVPFDTKKGNWIRYAVCATDVLAVADAIRDGFAKADVIYGSANM